MLGFIGIVNRRFGARRKKRFYGGSERRVRRKERKLFFRFADFAYHRLLECNEFVDLRLRNAERRNDVLFFRFLARELYHADARLGAGREGFKYESIIPCL